MENPPGSDKTCGSLPPAVGAWCPGGTALGIVESRPGRTCGQLVAHLPPGLAFDFQDADGVAQALFIAAVTGLHQGAKDELVDRRSPPGRIAPDVVIDAGEQMAHHGLGVDQGLDGPIVAALLPELACPLRQPQGPFDEQQLQLLGRSGLDFREKVVVPRHGRLHLRFLPCRSLSP